MTKIEELLGQTVIKIGGSEGDDELVFTLKDGSQCKLYHEQDCCESVTIEDINGNLDWLIGSPIIQAEESSSDTNPSDAKPEDIEYQDSFTWTFYKLATEKGHVVIRWYGESNGYYGEEVDFAYRDDADSAWDRSW